MANFSTIRDSASRPILHPSDCIGHFYVLPENQRPLPSFSTASQHFEQVVKQLLTNSIRTLQMEILGNNVDPLVKDNTTEAIKKIAKSHLVFEQSALKRKYPIRDIQNFFNRLWKDILEKLEDRSLAPPLNSLQKRTFVKLTHQYFSGYSLSSQSFFENVLSYQQTYSSLFLDEWGAFFKAFWSRDWQDVVRLGNKLLSKEKQEEIKQSNPLLLETLFACVIVAQIEVYSSPDHSYWQRLSSKEIQERFKDNSIIINDLLADELNKMFSISDFSTVNIEKKTPKLKLIYSYFSLKNNIPSTSAHFLLLREQANQCLMKTFDRESLMKSLEKNLERLKATSIIPLNSQKASLFSAEAEKSSDSTIPTQKSLHKRSKQSESKSKKMKTVHTQNSQQPEIASNPVLTTTLATSTATSTTSVETSTPSVSIDAMGSLLSPSFIEKGISDKTLDTSFDGQDPYLNPTDQPSSMPVYEAQNSKEKEAPPILYDEFETEGLNLLDQLFPDVNYSDDLEPSFNLL